MATGTNYALDALEGLSPYEVAILACTSPGSIANARDDDGLILLTGKHAYLWAGTVAHLIESIHTLTEDDIVKSLRHVWEELRQTPAQKYLDSLLDQSNESIELFISRELLRKFLKVFLPPDALPEIVLKTREAIQSLESLGLIVDPPIKKLIGNIALAVSLLLPVNFTETTELGEKVQREIAALDHNHLNHLSSSPEQLAANIRKDTIRRSTQRVLFLLLHLVAQWLTEAQSEEQPGLSLARQQFKLRLLGYYKGRVDGQNGPDTNNAFRDFQRDQGLPQTGFPDPETSKRLNKIAKM